MQVKIYQSNQKKAKKADVTILIVHLAPLKIIGNPWVCS